MERTDTRAIDATGGTRRGEPDGGGPDGRGADGGGPAEPDDAVAAVEEVDHPGGLSWGRVAVLGMALTFLGFAVGLFVSRDEPPAADSVDVGFVQDMLTHHEQALGVAALTVAYGDDPTVRSYAREVLTSQGYEQGRMSQMLFDWGYNRDDRSAEAMAWMDMAVPVDEMPGLLSDDQMDQIRVARGPEMDALFLDLMAEHHRGGLHMAQSAAQRAGDPEIRALAARMERNQAGEINEYRHAAQEMGLDLDIPGADVPPDDLPDGS